MKEEVKEIWRNLRIAVIKLHSGESLMFGTAEMSHILGVFYS